MFISERGNRSKRGPGKAGTRESERASESELFLLLKCFSNLVTKESLLVTPPRQQHGRERSRAGLPERLSFFGSIDIRMLPQQRAIASRSLVAPRATTAASPLAKSGSTLID